MQIQGYIFDKSESSYGFVATTGTLANRVKPLWLPRKKAEIVTRETEVSQVYATDGRYGANIATVEVDDTFAQRVGLQ